jgi:hypothetical protein
VTSFVKPTTIQEVRELVVEWAETMKPDMTEQEIDEKVQFWGDELNLKMEASNEASDTR